MSGDPSTSESFSVPELARRWKCDPRTVRAEIKSGRLVAFLLGRTLRVRLAEVTTYEARAPQPRPVTETRVPKSWRDRPRSKPSTPVPTPPALSLLEQVDALSTKHRKKRHGG